MALTIPFDNSYARLPSGFYSKQAPVPVAAPSMIAFNTQLGDALGIPPGPDDEMAQVFGGNAVPEGADPLAQLYAGHQFGHFNPQLGDGRALLLGEVVGKNGTRFDIQLKGSGPTPYSRRGDGRSWLGPVLREYVVSEAMHALGVPTTRALAAVHSGESVWRDGAQPGGILTRVARSHIRVGTFQAFAARRDEAALAQLYEYTKARHDPQANSPADLLAGVIRRHADLVAQWMSFGFIHGVMNTDNCTLSGETIDYGPCAFLDTYDPGKVFSSIDRYGRYAFDQQANVIVWNLAQLATALVPLMPDTDAAIAQFTEMVHAMPAQIQKAWRARFGRKIGLEQATPEDDALIHELLSLMHQGQADFTNMFRALPMGRGRDEVLDPAVFDTWEAKWRDRLSGETDAEARMLAANPAIIPRNHKIEEMIQASVRGDDSLFHRLNAALQSPYEDRLEHADLRRPPTPEQIVPATFCGT